ncbi:hypothetical protein NL676_006326 [Syzygium grande]|nr:hypothetical protein NL676_006326 [Syzygium grande]
MIKPASGDFLRFEDFFPVQKRREEHAAAIVFLNFAPNRSSPRKQSNSSGGIGAVKRPGAELGRSLRRKHCPWHIHPSGPCLKDSVRAGNLHVECEVLCYASVEEIIDEDLFVHQSSIQSEGFRSLAEARSLSSRSSATRYPQRFQDRQGFFPLVVFGRPTSVNEAFWKLKIDGYIFCSSAFAYVQKGFSLSDLKAGKWSDFLQSLKSLSMIFEILHLMETFRLLGLVSSSSWFVSSSTQRILSYSGGGAMAAAGEEGMEEEEEAEAAVT